MIVRVTESYLDATPSPLHFPRDLPSRNPSTNRKRGFIEIVITPRHATFAAKTNGVSPDATASGGVRRIAAAAAEDRAAAAVAVAVVAVAAAVAVARARTADSRNRMNHARRRRRSRVGVTVATRLSGRPAATCRRAAVVVTSSLGIAAGRSARSRPGATRWRRARRQVPGAAVAAAAAVGVAAAAGNPVGSAPRRRLARDPVARAPLRRIARPEAAEGATSAEGADPLL